MKTGILFDLDGTLLDTLADLHDSVNHTLAHFGYPQRTLEEVRLFVGNGARRLIDQAVPEGVDSNPAFAYFQSYYRDHCQIKTKPYDGIPEALEQLKEKYPVAIVSNKPDGAVKVLCAQYFPGIFALGEAPDCPRKPAPDMVRKGMASIGVDTCIYVGDSDVDILTARNAGVPCLSVLWGFRKKDEMDVTDFCENPAEMAAKLEEMIHGQ